MPDDIKNKPVLCLGLELYYNAFFALNDERDDGFNGLLKIKRRAILEYCEDWNLSSAQRDKMLSFIPEMDLAYLEYIKSRRPKPNGDAA